MTPVSLPVIRLMRHMLKHELTLEELREINGITLIPALNRNFIKKTYTGIALTPEGTEYAQSAGGQGVVLRKVERDVSKTVADLLGLVRAINEGKRRRRGNAA